MKPVGARYYEDIAIGEIFITPTRTITEADVLAYGGVSGDFEELHFSNEFAKTTVFGKRIAHGLLGLVILDGLKTRTSLVSDVHTTASLGWNWRFAKPLQIGSTVHGRIVIAKKRLTSSGIQGILSCDVELLDETNEVIQSGEHLLMVSCRPVQ
jgi:acyl dehydratase